MTQLPSRRRQRPQFRAFLLFFAVALLIAACGGGGSDADSTPTAAPSAQADELFSNAVQAVVGTTSMQFAYEVFEGDELVFNVSSRQAAPDRAHRTIDDKKTGVLTEAVIIGPEVCQRESNEQQAYCITLDPGVGEDPFSYPQTWIDENSALSTGWAVVGKEQVDGAPATLIRNWHADEEAGADAFNEELVYIDDATGRVVKWDINKYAGDEPELTQRWVSGTWQYNAPVEITLDGFQR